MSDYADERRAGIERSMREKTHWERGMNETKTPRCDREKYFSSLDGYGNPIEGTECIPYEIGCELESDLAAALAERDALAVKLAEAEKDAERWRFVRDTDWDDSLCVAMYELQGMELQAEVDAARGVKSHTHGIDCPKASHSAANGYLHTEADDSPYDVDGVMYCGRCHVVLP